MLPGAPTTMEEMHRLLTELQQRVTMLEEGRTKVHYQAPPKPRVGMRAFADGVHWNPGAGDGTYEFKADGQWHKATSGGTVYFGEDWPVGAEVPSMLVKYLPDGSFDDIEIQ